MQTASQSIQFKFAKYVSLSTLGMLGLSCYILADTYFVAKGLGTAGLAALNLAIALYSVIHATGLMLGIGAATKFTILKAQNKHQEANQLFTQAIIYALIIGVVYALIGGFGSKTISIMLGANQETLAMTNIYLKTIFIFSPFFILNNVLIAFVRNDNAPRLAMGAMLAGCLFNTIMDYVFIFPLNMGMFGAAFATGLAPIISLGLLSLHFFKKHNSFSLQKTKIALKALGKICSLGLSAFITEVSSGIVLIIFNIIILGLAGNTGVAAYGIIANLSLVAAAIFTGIGQGIQPLVSQSYGLKDKIMLKQILFYAATLALALAILIYVTINLTRQPLIALFNNENNETLRAYASTGLLLYFIGFIFAGLNIVFAAYLSAAHNPKAAFAISITRGFVAIIPVVLLLAHFWGIVGVWLAFPCTEGITFLVSWFCLRQKNLAKPFQLAHNHAK